MRSGLAFFGFLAAPVAARLSGTLHDGPEWALTITLIAVIASFGEGFLSAAYTGLMASLFLNFFFSGHYGRLLFDSQASREQVGQLIGLALLSSTVGHLRPFTYRTRSATEGSLSASQFGSMTEALDAVRLMRAPGPEGTNDSPRERRSSPPASAAERTNGHG
ncbi:MAG: hypothetical protein M3P01_13555 [Actinomycetota bacterium]|nr:hypothetical protein [Actinomycetota bacterium]